MKTLLLVAHGSRRMQSNDEIRALAEKVRAKAGAQFGFVSCAFLELAEPSIPDGIEACIQQGADEVVVMPYFLSAGRHVVEDVPALVRAKQAQYPAVVIRFAAYLGASQVMPDLILQTLAGGQCLCGKAQADCAYPACLGQAE